MFQYKIQILFLNDELYNYIIANFKDLDHQNNK